MVSGSEAWVRICWLASWPWKDLLSNKQQYLLLLKGDTKIAVWVHMHCSHRAVLPFLPSNSSCFLIFSWNRFIDYFYLLLPPALLCGLSEPLWLQWFSCLLLCHFQGLSGPCLSVCSFSPVPAPALPYPKLVSCHETSWHCLSLSLAGGCSPSLSSWMSGVHYWYRVDLG